MGSSFFEFGSVAVLAVVFTMLASSIFKRFSHPSRRVTVSDEFLMDLARMEAIHKEVGSPSLGSRKDVPQVFYYRNDEDISDLLGQLDGGLEKLKLKQVESSSEGSGSLGFRVFGFSPGLKGKKGRKVREDFEVRDSPVAALRSVYESVSSAGRVSRFNFLDGSSDLDGEAGKLVKSIQRRASRESGFVISEDVLEQVRQEYKSYRAAQQREDISKVAGYVEVVAEFTVAQSDSRGVELVVDVGSQTQDHTVVSIWCEHKWVQSIGRTSFSEGARVKASVFGAAVTWDERNRKQQVWPLAVYQ